MGARLLDVSSELVEEAGFGFRGGDAGEAEGL
jgi:hypothetical protein